MNEDTPIGQGQVPDPNLTKIEGDLAQLQKQAQVNVPAPVVSPTPQPAPVPTETVPPATPPVPEEIKKGSGGSLIKVGVVLLILALLAVGAYMFGNFITNKKVTSTPSPVSSQVLVETPTPTPDLITDWKTYINSVHNITFKYPQSWDITEKEGQKEGEKVYNTQVILTKDNAKIQMYFNLDGIGGLGQTYQGQPFNLDGNSLFRFVKTNIYDNTQVVGISTSLTNTLGVFEVAGKTYSITLTYPVNDSQSETGDSLEKEFDQILSTFEFIEATSSTSPSPSSRFGL